MFQINLLLVGAVFGQISCQGMPSDPPQGQDCGVGCLDCGTVVNEFQENIQDCMSCDSGFAYYIDPATQLGACTPCVTNCNECYASGFIGETYCVNCAEGFFGNDCEPKLTKCDDKCTSCVPDDYAGVYCEECGEGLDVLYMEEFSLVQTCGVCPENCMGGCEYGCQQCVPGFIGNMCDMPCPDSCADDCESGSCRRCRPGFAGRYCEITCPPGCLDCWQVSSTALTCHLCDEGFAQATSMAAVDVQECLPCDPECSYCEANSGTATTSCMTCNPGFTIDHWMLQDTGIAKCAACQSNCVDCMIDTAPNCLGEPNYGPVCLACEEGYLLVTKGMESECKACEVGCASCYEDDTPEKFLICSACKDGFTLSFNGPFPTCLPCPHGCSQCWEELMPVDPMMDPMMDPMNPMGPPPSEFGPSHVMCSTCQKGFSLVYDGVQQDTCAQCPPGCSNCWIDVAITSDDPIICYACEDDLILDEAGVCVEPTSDSSSWNMY